MSKIIKSHTAIVGANLIYGVNYVIAKGIMPDYVKPFGLVLMRLIGATLLFWMFSMFMPKERVKRKDIWYMVLCAFFGVVLNQLLFLAGLNYTTPIDSSIIMTANPILVLVVAAIILKERITSRKILGIIFGASGALWLILYSGKADFTSENFIGNIMIFLNALSYGIYLVLIKPMMMKYKPVTVMKWVFLSGLFFVTPVSYGQVTEVVWTSIPMSIILSIAFVIIATTFLAYLLNIYALQHVRPTTVSIYIYSQPVIASVVAIILGQDSISAVKIMATLLVFTGVYLVSIPSKFAYFKQIYFKITGKL